MSVQTTPTAWIKRCNVRVVSCALGVVGLGAASLYVWRSTSIAKAPEEEASEVKACCVAPPVSRMKALTSAPPPKSASENTAPHD